MEVNLGSRRFLQTLREIARDEAERYNNPAMHNWGRAYLDMADAANRLDAFIDRSTEEVNEVKEG